MRIYTRSGDDGSTSLLFGRRTSKDSLRVETYGTVDEANSCIGLALALLPTPAAFDVVRQFGARVQRDLFDVGRDLATPAEKRETWWIAQADVDAVERMIDQLSDTTPPLTKFVLPGGHPAAAALHQARTVVRRAERCLVALARQDEISPMIGKYLNRLSDLLFVAARAVNATAAIDEPVVDFDRPKSDVLAVSADLTGDRGEERTD